MKKYDKFYVYELVNSLGIIEYVGETTNIESRLKNHLSKSGKFYARTDITINLVSEFNNRKDAFNFQCQLQKKYGFETDFEKNIRGGDAVKRSILCFEYSTNKFIKTYNSITEAANDLNVKNIQISRVLSGERNKCHGCRFEYVK